MACEAWGRWAVRTVQANAINNRGEVVGISENRNGATRAFLWRPGRGMQGLGTLGGTDSSAVDINDATQVVGFSQTADGNDHAFLWTAARGMEDLGTLGGPTSEAIGISETGVVVGISSTAAGTEEAFLWTRGGGMRSLGTLGGNPSADANAVNTHRRVVGSHGRTSSMPFLWTPGDGMQPSAHARRRPGATQRPERVRPDRGNECTAGGALRAALWTPTAGPLAVAPMRTPSGLREPHPMKRPTNGTEESSCYAYSVLAHF